VYVPAVKDATTEQTEGKTTALGKLLARTVRSEIKFADHVSTLRAEAQTKYQEMLEASQGGLQKISESLNKRLMEWAHPDARLKVEWHASPDKSIRVEEPLARIIAGEGNFDGDLSRFGHGLQRSYLLALLQELSGNDDVSGPKLILGCEEPELHQHPPQARHLADVLYHLSTRNSQIIVSTHSPYFVNGERFQDVRLVRKDAGNPARISYVTPDQLAKTIAEAREEEPVVRSAMMLKMQQALLPGLNEIFFSRIVVFVEGIEDVAHITSYLHLLGLWEEFRRQGCHLVPADRKSNMLQPLAIAHHLQIPTFVIFDADCDKVHKADIRKKHELDNGSILRLRGYDAQSPFPDNTFWSHDTVMWSNDIGEIVTGEMGEKAEALLEEVRVRYGQAGGLDKTALFIAEFLSAAWEQELKSSSLEKVCRAILEFAKNPSGAPKPPVGATEPPVAKKPAKGPKKQPAAG
jgi:predicted ATP-dependent endonuclease of OLD family